MKSHINDDYLEVAYSIYKDACIACDAKVSHRDLRTIKSRVGDEGLSFLTITLPSYCADFERSLHNGLIDPTFFRCFRKNGSIPAFLQGMIGRIFNKETGRINDDKTINSPDAIARLVASIRQICLAFKKIELQCTPEREHKAMENFIEIERAFEMFTLPREDVEKFSRTSSVLWDNVMGDIHLDMLVPRHGPGATAERIHGNRKFAWQFWHERLEPYFPLLDVGLPLSCGEFDIYSSDYPVWENSKDFRRELEQVQFVHLEEEPPVRVTPVPKTLKGPRIIAIEPCCMQYAQQGIRRELYSRIESYWMTAGHVNFRDQSVNQSLAIRSSSDGQLATIDLSDASDRVPRDLAMIMFQSNRDLHDAIEACRSTRAKMPDGRVIGPLRKFASMGSALCFPVEAMYFYTVCVMALLEKHHLPVSHENCYKVSRDVYVYGDDIIVPVDCASTVFDYLQKYNCKVNARKTFWNGNFRESCGVDAYLGREVTPTYVGTTPPQNRQQASEILSWTETGNHFFRKGYLNTAFLFFQRIEKILGALPSVSSESSILGRSFHWDSQGPVAKRWNRNSQQLEVRCWVPAPVYRTDVLDGFAALQKCLMRLEGLTPSSEPYSSRPKDLTDRFIRQVEREASLDLRHLERTAQHGAVTLKRRWVPITEIGITTQ